jgi:hypothetical protein
VSCFDGDVPFTAENLYRYVDAEPTSARDPVGLSAEHPFVTPGSATPDPAGNYVHSGRDFVSEQVMTEYARAYVQVVGFAPVVGGSARVAAAGAARWAALTPAQRIELTRAAIELGEALSRGAPAPPKADDMPRRSPYEFVRDVKDASRRPMPPSVIFPRFYCPR